VSGAARKVEDAAQFGQRWARGRLVVSGCRGRNISRRYKPLQSSGTEDGGGKKIQEGEERMDTPSEGRGGLKEV